MTRPIFDADDLRTASLVRLVVYDADGKENITCELRGRAIRRLEWMLEHCDCKDEIGVQP